MKTLKIKAEYGCSPIWIKEEGGIFENILIDDEGLSLPVEIMEVLKKWQDEYENTYDENYPPDSAFSSLDAEKLFNQNGVKIWNDLIEYFNGKFKVIYFDVLENKL